MSARAHVGNVVPLRRADASRLAHPSQVFDQDVVDPGERSPVVLLRRVQAEAIASLIRGHLPPGRARDEALELLDRGGL